MQLYTAENTETDSFTLNKEESHHIVHVMRLRQHDIIYITDGRGMLIKAEIQVADAKACLVSVIERSDGKGKRSYDLHIAICPTKNIERFEWFLEKATEIGVDMVTPVFSERSERKVINPERLKKIIVSSAKQSLNTFFPVLNEAVQFKSFIASDFQSRFKMIAHCGSDDLPLIKTLYKKGLSSLILIGPEGDFTTNEITAAENAGFKAISLGKMRLRTETAGIAACCNIAFINQ